MRPSFFICLWVVWSGPRHILLGRTSPRCSFFNVAWSKIIISTTLGIVSLLLESGLTFLTWHLNYFIMRWSWRSFLKERISHEEDKMLFAGVWSLRRAHLVSSSWWNLEHIFPCQGVFYLYYGSSTLEGALYVGHLASWHGKRPILVMHPLLFGGYLSYYLFLEAATSLGEHGGHIFTWHGQPLIEDRSNYSIIILFIWFVMELVGK